MPTQCLPRAGPSEPNFPRVSQSGMRESWIDQLGRKPDHRRYGIRTANQVRFGRSRPPAGFRIVTATADPGRLTLICLWCNIVA